MIKILEPRGILVNETVQMNKSIIVEDGKIICVTDRRRAEKLFHESVIEKYEDIIFVPGTINAHNHSFQSLLRGLAADRPFMEWRDHTLYAYSPKMRLSDIYTGALFAFTEMMKCGVTTVCDFFYLHNFGMESDEAVIQAARDCGIRLVLARTMYDWDGAPKGYQETVKEAVIYTETLMKKYSGSMVKVIPAPHSLHAASPEMVTAGHSLSEKYNTPLHIHVAEEPFEVEQIQKAHQGRTPLEYLDDLGIVDHRLCIIHGVWLRENEIRTIGEKQGSLIYCPSSNMFLADGITSIPSYLKAGVTVALGTDGACSNNRISIFEEMRMASILQKASTCDAFCVTYHDAYQMGMANGEKVLGIPVGKIQKGYTADFVGINCQDFSMQPITDNGNQFLPNLIYSMQPTAISIVMVNGEITVRNGKLIKLTDQKVLREVNDTMKHLEADEK